MDMKEFERFNNVMDASIDKVVTDHLNKLSDIEYCVTTIQNIIANGGNTEILLTRATECVRTIKDEIEYFNSIDNIITSNLKELEEVKGRNRQLKEVNQNTLDTFKKITKEKDNKIKELNEKICRLTSENDSMSEIKLNLENEIKLKSDKNESLDSIIKEKDEEIYELNKRILSLETSIRDSEQSREDILNKINDSLNISISNKDNTDIRDMLTFIKKVLIGTHNKLNNVNSELNNNIDKISKIKDYESNFKELKEKVDCLNDSINKLDDTEKDEKIAELNDIIQMVKDNAKVMAVSQSCHIRKINKKEMHGKDNPRYNLSVDDNELIKDYEDGMILRELSEKYDMTIPGIRARLINLGVYKKKYNTKK